MLIIFVTLWLFWLSVSDMRCCRVPVWLLAAGGMGIGLALLYRGNADAPIEVLKGIFPGTVLLGTGLVTKKVGYGDGITVLLLGMLLGVGRILILFAISLFLISAYSLGLLMLGRAGRNTKIPYMPFLAAAWVLAGFV